MSIVNLYKTGIKDQDLVVDNLTVSEGLDVDVATVQDLVLNGTIQIPDPLELKDNVVITEDLTVGTLANNNSLNLNCDEIDCNDDMKINIQSGQPQALKFSFGATDMVVLDTVDNNMILDNDLSVGADLSCDNCSVNNASNLGNVSKILVAQGSHNWANAEVVGANILSIGGLDGDTHKKYLMEFDYVSDSSNANFNLTLRYNGNSDAEYSFSEDLISVMPVSSLSNSNGDNESIFVNFASADLQRGSGTFELCCDRTLSDIIMSRTTLQSKASGANNIIKNDISQAYENGVASNITSIDIDVNNTNQAGTTLQYRLYRMV